MALISPGVCGTFFYNGSTWSGIGGTASGYPSDYTANNDTIGVSPSLTLTSPGTGDNWNLYGSVTYDILWTPASPTDTPPADAEVSWYAQDLLTVAGNGSASITNSSGSLDLMNSTNDVTSGAVSNLYTFNTVAAISLQPDGTYQATGTISSDTLNTTYNSSGGGVSSAQEFLTVTNIQGGS